MNANASPSPESRPPRRLWLLGVFAALGGLSAGLLVRRLASSPSPSQRIAPEIPGLLWPNPKRLTAFALEGTDGEPFNLSRFKGRWSFLFFGFTFCPDICPTTLTTMASAMDQIQLKTPARDVQVVFVSVDPARDTLARMKSYVEYFNSSFVGARASVEALEKLTQQLGILHFRGKPDDQGHYEVDHSASILLVDPQAQLVGIFGTPHVAGDIASRYQAIRAFMESV